MAMDISKRSRVTEYLKHQAEALQLLEALQEDIDSLYVATELVKIQHEQVNLQTRFTRLVYLSGEV